MTLLISTMRLFDCNAIKKSKKQEEKTELREKRLLLKFERIFSPVDTSSSNQCSLIENTLKYTPQKKTLRNKSERSSPQVVDIFNSDNLAVAFTRERRVRMED